MFSGPAQLHINDARVLKEYGAAEEIEACSPELQPVNNIHTFGWPLAIQFARHRVAKDYKSPCVYCKSTLKILRIRIDRR